MSCVVSVEWLLLLASAAAAYACLRRWTTLDLYKIPTPWGLPFVGQLIQLATCVYTPHQQFLKWHESLGSIVRLRIFHRDVVLVSHPQVAAQVLAKGPNECWKRAPEYATYDVAHGMHGYHAIMTEHNEERWRAIRKGIAPAYSMAAIRQNFGTIVRSYAHICEGIEDGTAWREPMSAAEAAAVAADTSIQICSKKPGSSSSSNRSSMVGDLGAEPGWKAGAAAASGKAVCIDEEIFAATLNIFMGGFLQMSKSQVRQVDSQQAAADVSGLVAITNSFLSQPWKQWLYRGIPGLCQEARAFHAQRSRLMQLTDMLAHHVEQHRPPLDGSSTGGGRSSGGGSSSSSSSSPSRGGDTAAAAAGDGVGDAAAAAAKHTAGIDSSLVGCLAKLREPETGELFDHKALQAELFLEAVGQESIPWTMAWTLFLLTQNPEAEAKVLQELRDAGVPCDGDSGAAAALLSLDLLKQLPYCTAVLQEAMRLFPAGVMAASRITQQETQVGPYRVPAGVIVFPCLYSILMHSANWDQPTEFKPERWLEPNAATDPASGATRFVPFGVGPKACVAQQLAYVQLKVLMVLLLSSFSWQLAPCMGGPEGVLSCTVAALELRVDKGMWLIPTRRTA